MPAPRPMTLSVRDQERLCLFLQRGKATARIFKRAQVLLKLERQLTSAEIADAYSQPEHVSNVRTRFLRGELEACSAPATERDVSAE